MRDALLAVERPILYSLCSWGSDDVWQWGSETGNSWRTTQDIEPHWWSISKNFLENDAHTNNSGPGAWNDPDMLEIGNGNLTMTE